MSEMVIHINNNYFGNRIVILICMGTFVLPFLQSFGGNTTAYLTNGDSSVSFNLLSQIFHDLCVNPNL